MKCFQPGICTLHFHGLVEVEVEESGLAVVENVADDFECVALQRSTTLSGPCHKDGFCLLANNGGIDGCREGLQLGEHRLTHISTGFPSAEILVNDGDGLVGVKVSSHTYSRIVGHVPLLEVVLDVDN